MWSFRQITLTIWSLTWPSSLLQQPEWTTENHHLCFNDHFPGRSGSASSSLVSSSTWSWKNRHGQVAEVLTGLMHFLPHNSVKALNEPQAFAATISLDSSPPDSSDNRYRPLCHFTYTTMLVAWSSGRTSVFGRRAFAVLRSTCSWFTHLCVVSWL